MTKKTRIFALLLIFLFLMLLPLPIYAEDGEGDTEESETLPENWKPYSFSYEEGDAQASLYLHPVYAERGDVDLLDAFVEAAAEKASFFISIGSVKLYLSSKLVSDVAKRGDPVLLYIEELSEKKEEAEGGGEETSDESPSDVVYRFKISFPFSYRSFRIGIKHLTKNADGIHLISSDEAGTESVLKSAYGNSLVSFFPEEQAFTVRITENPLPEKTSPIPILLFALLLLLVAGSVTLLILIKTGLLKRAYLYHLKK